MKKKIQKYLTEKGTALFIAATLLEKAVETLVPMQAAAILSLLYGVSVKSNSIVSGWVVMIGLMLMYIGVDLGVEMVVFVGTVLVLKDISRV